MLTIAVIIWGEESAASENTEGIILESATFEGEDKKNNNNESGESKTIGSNCI